MKIINKLFLPFILSVLLFPAISHAGENSSTAPVAATTAAPAVSEKARFDHALGLYMQGSFTPASEEFRGYLKDFPEGEHADDSLYWLGKYRELADHFDEAAIMLRRAISDFPTSDIAASIQFELGYCLYSPKNPGRDLPKAFAEFMKVPSLYQGDPAVPQALYYAAMCQLELSEFMKAKEIFTRIAARFPDSPYAAPALYNLGRISITEGNTVEASASFKTLLNRYPAGLYSNEAASAAASTASAEANNGLAAATLK